MLDSSRDWYFSHPDLSRNDALLLCEITRWGDSGCYKSSRQLAKDLKFHPRTVQRLIKSLYKRQWLAIFYEHKQLRILYATPKEPPIGPLFDYKEKTEKVIRQHTKKQTSQLINQLSEKIRTEI